MRIDGKALMLSSDQAVSIPDLEASAQEDGLYEIFTCGCGVAGCAGLAPIEVIQIDGKVLWEEKGSDAFSYTFDATRYHAEITAFCQELRDLARQHPDISIPTIVW
jgi:hypothetical protein